MKRSRSARPSESELVSEMNPKSAQLLPASIEYCQRPSLASTDWPRTTMPVSDPASAASLKLPA